MSNNEIKEIDEINEYRPGFWTIQDTGVRMFLVEGSERAMLVDTGFGKSDLKKTVAGLTKLSVFLVNTHADHDHVGANKQFGSTYMNPKETEYYVGHNPNDIVTMIPTYEGQVFDLGDRKFEVIDIPGHTPGCIALLDRANRILISGDSLSLKPVFMFGTGRNLVNYLDSMRKLDRMKDSFDTIWPSHGDGPLEISMIGEYIEAAELLLAGKLVGSKPERDLPCLQYRHGRAQFFY